MVEAKTRVNIRTLDWLNRFLDVPMATPDTRRRARLLNILLAGTAFIIVSVLLVTIAGQLAGLISPQVTGVTYASGVPFIGVIVAIYAINRYWSEEIAAILFLLLFIAVLYASDTPYESVWGRNTLALAVPIFMASVILPPAASFSIAGIVSLVALVITYYEAFDLNYIGIAAFFVIAFASWLSSRSMERAVVELREINQELDQKVVERTAELRETNAQLELEADARKRANAALVVARDQALEASRLKSQLLANVSHELRTPLGAILGFAEMLRVGFYGPVNEPQRLTINKIIETNQDLTKHVSELLDQAQLEAGKLKLNSHIFDPGKLLFDVVNVLSILAEEKGLELIHRVDPNLPITLVGDPVRLQQILMNLAGNAIKFTNKGSVTTSVCRVNEDEWALTVEDTGPGIPQEAQGYIFEPFRQVDGSVTRVHEGSGLGLSIVKQLAALMNGRVTLNSELGQGSLFTVILPIILPDEENVA